MEKGREWDTNIFGKSCVVPWDRRRGAALRGKHPTELPGAPVAQPVEATQPEAVYETDQDQNYEAADTNGADGASDGDVTPTAEPKAEEGTADHGGLA
eukprot:9574838-Alexandrium_andersonii.AAC.1